MNPTIPHQIGHKSPSLPGRTFVFTAYNSIRAGADEMVENQALSTTETFWALKSLTGQNNLTVAITGNVTFKADDGKG